MTRSLTVCRGIGEGGSENESSRCGPEDPREGALFSSPSAEAQTRVCLDTTSTPHSFKETTDFGSTLQSIPCWSLSTKLCFELIRTLPHLTFTKFILLHTSITILSFLCFLMQKVNKGDFVIAQLVLVALHGLGEDRTWKPQLQGCPQKPGLEVSSGLSQTWLCIQSTWWLDEAQPAGITSRVSNSAVWSGMLGGVFLANS